ncbi:amino acid permease-domain-containing protein [Plectosphaerella plurivora]|uniref:Amino acid permease-domain-containing protein n=1 Tax=Plectosphaerella plurivora TaxID=936078 RepID=A0A9P8V819_9PEZI|nr:amino acid permease-domain-containing protein [Plectosphaerella plurivora]
MGDLGGRLLQDTQNSDAIVTDAPGERYRLGFVDVACLIINRMIGTGIFNSPRTVIVGTRSAGGAMILWFFGTMYALAGTHVYIEYGLNVPRYVIEGVEQAVPRSGGDLHYLSFVYSWPYYQKGTVLYSAVLYGISFICVANMAGNCINFGTRVLVAANPGADINHTIVCAIATAAAFFSCLVHAVSRRGGIVLNNFLAIVKVCILLIIPGVTFAVLAGAIRDENGGIVRDVFGKNMAPSVAFQPPRNFDLGAGAPSEDLETGTVNSYAAAFLSIVFAFGGFEQSNHVLGEIRAPRRTFPRAATFAVGLVGILYMFCNICYMAVVPAYEQSTGVVALIFFQKTFGQFPGDTRPNRIFNSFLALSSFGNIIVTTYTAARMKQEIAKQGFIPFPKFFAQDADVSIGRLVLYLRRKGWKVPFFSSPEEHREATPVGALVLHLGACLVLIWSTIGIPADDAYGLLSSLSAYLITAFFGIFLALGILILRVVGPQATEAAKTQEPMRRSWRQMTRGSVYSWLSISTAVLYLIGNAFPVIASWIPRNASFGLTTVKWLVVPTICWTILGIASAWWVGFLIAGRIRSRRQHKTLVHEVWPEFDWAEPVSTRRGGDDDLRQERRRRDGGKVLVHETVLFTWEVEEMDDLQAYSDMQERDTPYDVPLTSVPGPMEPDAAAMPPGRRRQPPPEDDLAGTTFDNFAPPRWAS